MLILVMVAQEQHLEGVRSDTLDLYLEHGRRSAAVTTDLIRQWLSHRGHSRGRVHSDSDIGQSVEHVLRERRR